MGKRIAIIQSNYIPWKGYFDLINYVDEFILFDDMQFTKRDWRNRNRIKTPGGLQWLTIPVEVKNKYHQKIKDTVVSDLKWNKRHWKTIVHNYSKAKYFHEYRGFFEGLYLGTNERLLSQINYRFLTAICEILNIKTKISWSMDYHLIEGKGKLGTCSAACFAFKGFEVMGVDINRNFVDAINEGKAPIYEPRLQELITASKGKLRATQDYEEAIRESEISFLIVPTPSREDGHFSDKYLQDALNHLSLAIKKTNKKYHLIVITSTVSPGTTDENLIPLIESVSGKKLNKDFGICYNPEFIALGSVINDFLRPDFVLIGESHRFAGDQLVEIYTQVCENRPCISRMSVISAEITKISLNAYVTMKISFANTLANICEAIPGADIDAITKALGADRRISPYFIRGGLSYGGPCFPRDNRAFAAFAKQYGIDAKLAKATDETNKFQVEHLVERASAHLPSATASAVGILGLAYKPNTPVIEESPAVRLIEEFLRKGLKVIVYDPLAMDAAMIHFGDKILYASSAKDCLANSSLCIIATQAEEFKSIDDSYVVHNPTILIDCWRLLNPAKLGERVRYIALGRSEG